MSDLALYLRGHHAGGHAAIRGVKAQVASDPDSDLGRFLGELGQEIEADHGQLRDVMGRLGVAPGRLRDLLALTAGQLSRWALLAMRPGQQQARLVGLESLSLGIEGKAVMWRALREIARSDPRLSGIDLDDLLDRAVRQRDRLEPYRLEAARPANGEAAPDQG